ncbi:MAG: Hsp70 family protein [Thermoanaerobaculaceae bacterium]
MRSLLSVLSKAALARRTGPVRVLGIDLGTTNSTVAEAVWRPESGEPPQVRCVDVAQPTPDGTFIHALLPSTVAISEGRVWVGEGAKRLAARTGELGLEPQRSLFAECKNDMGVRRTYHRAPEGFRSAPEIAGHVLRTLTKAALQADPTPPARVVVTVPASFQVAQRRDTRAAAERAGLTIAGGDLLDEPLAAFLDFAAGAGEVLDGLGRDRFNLAVLDFGGGTCDVAVLAVSPGASPAELGVAPRAVSRYHRLGGGDIDAAIVYEVLIPELVRQNHLGAHELGFAEKKQVVEPALRGVAESLKIALCQEITRLQGFGTYEGADRSALRARLAITHEVVLPSPSRTLRLANPTLTAAQLDAVLAPFLDRDLLYARDTEYRLTCSIFAPLQDALERAGLERDDVQACLLVGGSTLAPQVREAVRGFFPHARVLTHADADGTQMAVARGAAWHALALAVTGRGIVQSHGHDAIALRTAGGRLELVPAGAALPYPGAGPGRKEGLVVPVSSAVAPVPVRVEVVAVETGQERLVHASCWKVPGPVAQGTRLFVEYRFDENQVLELGLGLADDPTGPRYQCEVENPLTHVVNPNATRMKIEELEEAIRTGEVAKEEVPDKLTEVAELLGEIGQRERALAILKRVLHARNQPDAVLLNRMGILAGELGDSGREEKYYREAALAEPRWASALFNLALALSRRRQWTEAALTIEQALAREVCPPYLVLKAQIVTGLGREQERERLLAGALTGLGVLRDLDDWTLGWLVTGAAMAKDDGLAARLKSEQQRRRRRGSVPVSPEGVLPASKDDWLM